MSSAGSSTVISRISIAMQRLLPYCDETCLGVFLDEDKFNAATNSVLAADILSMAGGISSSLSASQAISESIPSLVTSGPAKKVFCDKCRFMVNPVGHGLRCKVESGTPSVIKHLAWIGDTMLSTHVRLAVFDSCGVDEPMYQRYISNVTLAEAYHELNPSFLGKNFIASGTSNHNLGTYVEAAYAVSPEFRARYMDWTEIELPDLVSLNDTFSAMVVHHFILENPTSITPNKYVFGFCYMALFKDMDASNIAKRLGPFPLSSAVQKELVVYGIEGAWYITHSYSNIYHVSPRRVSESDVLLVHSGKLSLPDGSRIGAPISIHAFNAFYNCGEKNCDLSEFLSTRELYVNWNVDVSYKYARLREMSLALSQRTVPWYICTTSAVIDTLSVAITTVDRDSFVIDVGQVLLVLLNLVSTASNAAIASTNSTYVATNGPLALVRVAISENVDC